MKSKYFQITNYHSYLIFVLCLIYKAQFKSTILIEIKIKINKKYILLSTLNYFILSKITRKLNIIMII